MKRITAREFRVTFGRLTEPTRVGGGCWIPDLSAWPDIEAKLEGIPTPVAHHIKVEVGGKDITGKIRVPDPPRLPKPDPAGPVKVVRDFSKAAQSKGRMGRQ